MPIYLGNQNVLLRNGGGGSGNTNSVALTQAEYDALTTEEKNNGTIYFITNGVPDNLIVNDSVPIGAIQAYAGTTTPTGWLICDGSAVSRTTYSELFEAIGTTYGTGDGSTTFNLPDLRGRTAIGADPDNQSTATGHTAHALGQKGGEETHTLTINEMPSHVHYDGTSDSVSFAGTAGTNTAQVAFDSTLGRSTTTTGGGLAHNNMQPYTVTYYIIKAKNNSPTETATLSMLDMFYPVGSYYETSDSTFNPNATWGGTWVLEAEGLVHIGAGANYTIGDTGGEATHTLTSSEMPAHKHPLRLQIDSGVVSGHIYQPAPSSTSVSIQTNATYDFGNTNSTGSGTAHNNMQPYIVVNRWHRTA